MEFKHNHSEGPWALYEEDSEWYLLSDGKCIADINFYGDDDLVISNMYLTSKAPAMRDYLIKRAKWLWEELLFTKSVMGARNIEEDVKTELREVISILRSAGVEVVCDEI